MSEMTKMTVKFHGPMWDSFDTKIRRLPVKRNPFLNQVIKKETPRLARAMVGKKLSSKANRWISVQLNSMDIKTVSIDVEKDVAHNLNNTIAETHMVRDAFLNRLVAFLRSSDSLLDYFQIPRTEDGSIGKTYGSDLDKPTSPLTTLETTFDDPLWYLHEAIREVHAESLYLLDFPSPKLDGFACWLSDAQVPGTRESRRQQREVEDIMKSLGVFEAEAFAPAKAGRE